MQGLATDFLDFRVGSVFLSCPSYVSWLRQIIFLHVRERLQFKLGVERNLLYWIVAEVTNVEVVVFESQEAEARKLIDQSWSE